MRVLILSKRQYTNKDLLNDQYGRIFEIAKGLTEQGVKVSGLSLSYRTRDKNEFKFNVGNRVVPWHSVNLFKRGMLNIGPYLKQANDIVESFKPDFIWASSDALHIIIASRLGRKHRIKVIADLYDNYNAFGAAHIPGLKTLFNRSLRGADTITCASHAIAEIYKPLKHKTVVIENAVDTNIFTKLNQQKCRIALGFAEDAKIIGTAGSLSNDRDIELLFHAFMKLSKQNNKLHLALAGKIGRGVTIPQHSRVHYLGELAYNRVPILLNSMDVAVVCNKASDFGNFCFPQKMYEIISCETPIVLARTPAVAPVLAGHPGIMYLPGDIDSLMVAIEGQLQRPNILDIAPRSWSGQAAVLIEEVLKPNQAF